MIHTSPSTFRAKRKKRTDPFFIGFSEEELVPFLELRAHNRLSSLTFYYHLSFSNTALTNRIAKWRQAPLNDLSSLLQQPIPLWFLLHLGSTTLGMTTRLLQTIRQTKKITMRKFHRKLQILLRMEWVVPNFTSNLKEVLCWTCYCFTVDTRHFLIDSVTVYRCSNCSILLERESEWIKLEFRRSEIDVHASNRHAQLTIRGRCIRRALQRL